MAVALRGDARHAPIAMATLPIETGSFPSQLEPRIAKLEAHAEHTVNDLREIRTDLRALTKKVDQHFYVMLGAIVGLAGLMAKGFHWL